MSAIATKVASKLLKDRAEQYQPADPHYEYYEENGKKKKKKRGVPDGLSKKDAKILRKIRKRAHYLDKGMNICGFRVGWTFFIGIIPGAGDVANALLNYTLVYKPSKKLDLPSDLTSKMLFNNAISAGVGLVPVAGDIFLAAWKANSRNAHLYATYTPVSSYLTIRGQEYLASLNQGSSTIPPAGMEGVQANALRSFFLGSAGQGGVQTYGSMEDVGATSAAPGQGQGRVQGPPVTAPRPAVAGAPAARR